MSVRESIGEETICTTIFLLGNWKNSKALNLCEVEFVEVVKMIAGKFEVRIVYEKKLR